MKIYVAMAGEYSDRGISGVFARREDAEAYELGDDVEEHEVAEGPVEVRTWHTLQWDPRIEERPLSVNHAANPHEYTTRRNFDGHPRKVVHQWRPEMRWPDLIVEGWDLEAVRKVYSEQRAQYVARTDMGVEST